jgi:hypothetical protein
MTFLLNYIKLHIKNTQLYARALVHEIFLGNCEVSITVSDERVIENKLVPWQDPGFTFPITLDEPLMTFGAPGNTPKYQVSLSGKGLKKGSLGKVASIYVKVTKGGAPVKLDPSKIDLTIVGVVPPHPAAAKVSVLKAKEGEFVLRYLPQKEGDYKVNVVVDGDVVYETIVPWRDPFGTAFDIPIEPTPLLLLDLPILLETPEFNLLAGGPGLRIVQLNRCAPLALRFLDKNDKPVHVDVARLNLTAYPTENPSSTAPHVLACPVNLVKSSTDPSLLVGRYLPTSPGPYKVNLLLDGSPVLDRIVPCQDADLELPLVDIETLPDFNFHLPPIHLSKYTFHTTGLACMVASSTNLASCSLTII